MSTSPRPALPTVGEKPTELTSTCPLLGFTIARSSEYQVQLPSASNWMRLPRTRPVGVSGAGGSCRLAPIASNAMLRADPAPVGGRHFSGGHRLDELPPAGGGRRRAVGIAKQGVAGVEEVVGNRADVIAVVMEVRVREAQVEAALTDLCTVGSEIDVLAN